jgi:hypothetical protein
MGYEAVFAEHLWPNESMASYVLGDIASAVDACYNSRRQAERIHLTGL